MHNFTYNKKYDTIKLYVKTIKMEVKSEQQYSEIKGHIAAKDDSGPTQQDQFANLHARIQSDLAKQASDDALKTITFSALDMGVSDVHYDQSEEQTVLRFRIDGRLADVCTLTSREYKLVLERLKYKSNLKLNITHIPQDGKYRIDDEQQVIDVRVSTLPTRNGENVVSRIQD